MPRATETPITRIASAPQADTSAPRLCTTRREAFTVLGSLAAGAALTSAALAITAPLAVTAENMDVELLAACDDYHTKHQAWLTAQFISDEECDHQNGLRQEAMEPVVPFHPHTPEGLHAKASVALSAMLFLVDGNAVTPWRQHATPEETLALDVLAAYRTGVA